MHRADAADEGGRNPLYDPRRDGVTYHEDVTAQQMGDPVPGRSALDQMRAEGRDPESTLRNWRYDGTRG